MFERSHLKKLKERLVNEPRRFIQVLYGPRQVGKTTIAQQLSDQAGIENHYVSADAISSDNSNWIEQQWNMVRVKMVRDNIAKAVLIIDEVQKVHEWSEYIKKEWDSDTRGNIDIRLLLLGSSRLLIQQGLTESLAGRFETIYASHWTFEEMNTAFGMDQERYVWFGGYPGAASLIDNEERWLRYINDSIVESTISRDILMLSRVDKPALMRRMFEFGCKYSGQILSYTKMLGQLHDAGNTTTLAHYLYLLDTAGLLGGLEKFSPDLIRKRASSPKFQVHNNALMTAVSGSSLHTIINDPSKWGRWVESAIGTHLLNHSISGNMNVYYWREGNNEVDFILEHKQMVIAIEIKSGIARPTAGMKKFRERYHPHKVYLIGKNGLSWKEFLCIDPVELF